MRSQLQEHLTEKRERCVYALSLFNNYVLSDTVIYFMCQMGTSKILFIMKNKINLNVK